MPILNLVARTVSASAPTLTNAAYKDGLWYVFTTDNTNCRLYKSADLINWTLMSTLDAFSLDVGPDVLMVGGGFYVIGGSGHYRYSVDGTNWTLGYIPGGDFIITRVKYLGGRFFAFCTAGLLTGTTMSSLTAATGVAGARAVEYDGKGLFVCIGADHKVYTSTNGTSWTANAFTGMVAGYANDPYFVNLTYGDGVWVASGNESKLFRSTDLVNWTMPSTGGQYGIAYGGGLWVATDGTTTKVSTDGGLAWTGEAAVISGGAGGGVTYANGLWCLSARSNQLAAGYATNQTHNRTFSGVVRDSAGNFAARRVSLLREDHSLINTTMSSVVNGACTLKSSHKGETIALISGEPAKNAIVFERVTPPAAA